MDLMQMQTLLAARFPKDHSRLARMSHFMGLLKSAVDGMAGLGVVLRVEADGLDAMSSRPPPPARPDPLESLDTAIAHMVRASSHATYEKGPED